uniref:Uncharacterized protein n=1 Tax=Leersia perrieri TaxID=77586 RepID=A0A0D9WN97_9ORYZ
MALNATTSDIPLRHFVEQPMPVIQEAALGVAGEQSGGQHHVGGEAHLAGEAVDGLLLAAAGDIRCRLG